MFDRYAYWSAHIAGGRSKVDRPMSGSRTKRAYLRPDGRIVLRLHNTDVVTLYPDGTEVIRTDGWNTVTTRAFLSEHSKAHVWQEKWQQYVRIPNPTITKPRVQKCRQCHGTGELPQECYGPWQRCDGGPKCEGPRFCFPAWQDCPHGETDTHLPDTCAHGESEAHSLGLCDHGQQEWHRVGTCDHGQATRHALPNSTCYRCAGVGRYDYGSREVHYAWSGEPLTIDVNGYPVGPEYVPPTSSSAPVKATSYSDSGALLRTVLPALETARVDCPACADDPRNPSQEMILSSMVIHLNDTHRWAREAIADWLETLDVDLSFPVPDTIPSHIR
jgi:hypothetical protein